MATVSLYTAAFTNDKIFRTEHRSTCIGTCQIFARIVTTLSSEVNELPAPLPIMIFLGSNVFALITCLALPDDTPVESIEDLKKNLDDLKLNEDILETPIPNESTAIKEKEV